MLDENYCGGSAPRRPTPVELEIVNLQIAAQCEVIRAREQTMAAAVTVKSRTASAADSVPMEPSVTFDFSILNQALQQSSQEFLREIKEHSEDLEQHKGIISKITLDKFFASDELRKETISVKALEYERTHALTAYEKSISTRDQLVQEISAVESDDRYIQASIALKSSRAEAELMRKKYTQNNNRQIRMYDELIEDYHDNADFDFLRYKVTVNSKGDSALPLRYRLAAKLSNFWEELRKYNELCRLRLALDKYSHVEDHFGFERLSENYAKFIDDTFPEYRTMVDRLMPEVTTNLETARKLLNDIEKSLEAAKGARHTKYMTLRKANNFAFSPSFNAVKEIEQKLYSLRLDSFESERRHALLNNAPAFRAICSSKNTFGIEEDALDTILIYLNNRQIEPSVVYNAICPKYKEIPSVTSPVIRVSRSRKSTAPIRVSI